MTSYLKISGSLKQINFLFENPKFLSVRYFNSISNNQWDITIRHSDYFPEVVVYISKATTVSELILINDAMKNISQEKPENKLRSVLIIYSNGDFIPRNMASHLTDQEIRDYFSVGRYFNIGEVNDNMQKVKKCIILH